MSEADLEAVRRSYEDFNRGDLDGWLGWFAPEATWQSAREDPRRRAAQRERRDRPFDLQGLHLEVLGGPLAPAQQIDTER